MTERELFLELSANLIANQETLKEISALQLPDATIALLIIIANNSQVMVAEMIRKRAAE